MNLVARISGFTGEIDGSHPHLGLVAAALADDVRAQRELFELLLPAVQRTVGNALRGRLPRVAREGLRAEAADLVGDVWVALLANDGKRLRAWDPARGPLVPYVELCARHLVYAFLRNRGRGWSKELPWGEVDVDALRGEDESPESVLARGELREAVLAAVEAQLTVEARAVLVLLAREGLSVAEICARTGLSANAVHVKQYRIVQLAKQAAKRLQRGQPGDG